MRRTAGAITSLLALAVLVWPAFHPSEIDSLPLSNYPMFAHPRGRVTRFVMAVVVDTAGEEHRLDPADVGGTDQPMQAAMTLQQAIDLDSADVLCAEIAAGLDAEGTVQVLSVVYDAVAWFRGEREPLQRQVHAECPTRTAA
jgi:hypothetical protein